MDQVFIIRLSSLGDVILATSVIDAVRAAWPDSAITFIVKEEYAPVLDQNPELSRVLVLKPAQRGLLSLWRLGRGLRREGADLVLDLQGGPRGRALSAAIGSRRVARADSRRISRMLMTARPARWRRQLPHAVERYLECLRRWTDGAALSRGPRVWLTDIEKSKARAALQKTGIAPTVALAPGAKWRSKRWPERSFAQLAGALALEGSRVVVVGSEDEEPLVRRIVAAADDADLVSGICGGLRSLAAAFSACGAAVCNDSGLMHLAAAVGTPTLGIFGPTAPHFGFAPYGAGHETLWLGFECSPCSLHGDKPCRIAEKAPCMEDIDPGMVLSALRSMFRVAGEGRSDRRSDRTRTLGGNR